MKNTLSNYNHTPANDTMVINTIIRDCKSMGTDLVECVGHHNTCEICSIYQDRVFSLSGKDKRFPKLPQQVFQYGGFHEGCRHSFYPFIYKLSIMSCGKKDAIRWSNRPFVVDHQKIRPMVSNKPITYEKQSKIVSIFTKKWSDICSKEFVVLDFETTGLDKFRDRILEIAAIRFLNGEETDKFVTLVNPQMMIPAEAMAVHHISNSMVKNAPVESVAIPQLINYLGDSLIVGHNVNFDVGFLEVAANRFGKSVKYNYIDTLSISKKLFQGLPNYKLGTIATCLKINTSSLHRAEADVRVCAEIVNIALNSLMDCNSLVDCNV